MRKLFLITIMILLLATIVSANENWWNFGNIGYTEGNGYPYFASMTPSNHNISNPFVCEAVLPIKFTPVIGDINLDGSQEIIIATSTQQLRVYDFQCSQLLNMELGQDINSMPIILNVNGDTKLDVIIHGSVNVTTYTFTDLVPSVINSIVVNSSAEFGMTCAPYSVGDTYLCQSFINPNKIVNYNIVGLTKAVTTKTGLGTYEYRGFISNMDGTGNAHFNFGTDYETPIGLTTDSGGLATILTYSFETSQRTNCNFSNGTTAFTSNTVISSGLAKIGTGTQSNIILMNLLMSSVASSGSHAVLCDVTGTRRFNYTGFNNTKISNWAVGDINKDGGNEACFVYYNLTTEQRYIACLNSGYASIMNAPIPDYNSASIGFALADFDNTNSYLEAVTPNGILKYDGTNWTTLYSVSDKPLSFDGRVIVVEGDTSRNNKAVYTETTKLVIFGFEPQIVVSCGDGICQGSENVFTCPQDCMSNVTSTANLSQASETCNANSDCITGFCLYGFCSLKSNGDSCVHNYECDSAQCVNGKCKKASLWQLIDSGKDSLAGDDDNTNNFISIAIILAIVAGVVAGSMGNVLGVLLAIVSFYAGAIFFTSVGWLSSWILIILIVMGIMGTIVLIFLKQSSG